ncbi:MAG: hypothetical protein KDK39_10130 [Leptospiraceae bacterium]|nr:hypothetical protein [Leptospiraceae bacterium]
MRSIWPRLTLWLLPVYFLILVAIRLVGGAEWWALQVAAPSIPLLLALAALSGLTLFWSALQRSIPPGVRESFFLRPAGWSWLYWPIAVAGVVSLMVLLHGLRARLFLPAPAGLGDSYYLAEQVPIFTHLFGYLDSFDELIPLFLVSRLYAWLQPAGGSIFDSYALISFVAGAAYLALWTVYLRHHSWFAMITAFALLGLYPAIQVFAGYPENYPLSSLALFALLLFGLQGVANQTRRGPQTFWLVAGMLFGAGILTHLMVVVMAPGMLVLLWMLSQAELRTMFRRGLLFSAGGLVVVLPVWVVFLALMENPVEVREAFVANPPVLMPWQWWHMDHIRNMINLILIGSPAIIPGLLLLGSPLSRWQAAPLREAARRMTLPARLMAFWQSPPTTPDTQILVWLAVSSLTYLVFIFTLNPLLGFPADWDVFSFFQLPLNLFLFYGLAIWLPKQAGHLTFRRIALALLVYALSIAMGTGFLERNHRENEQSIQNRALAGQNVLDTLQQLERDPMYSKGIPGERKKTYVRVVYFVVRTHNYFKTWPHPEAQALLRDLDGSLQQFQSLVALPEDDYRREIGPVWSELTRLNLELSKLQNKAALNSEADRPARAD